MPRTTPRRRPAPAPAPEATPRKDNLATPLAAPDADVLWEISPSRYIAQISLRSGQELMRPIDPADLLVHAHRDKHPVEVAAQYLASRVLSLTGNEQRVREGLRLVNTAGSRLAEMVGAAVGSPSAERLAKQLLGVIDREVAYKFREPSHMTEREVESRVERLQKDARAALDARGRRPRLRVLLTGATGFLGREILVQAAADRSIDELVAVVRPETIRDPKTRAVVRILSPKERGALLLRRLGIKGPRAAKFRFVEGDIEKPGLGIAAEELQGLRKTLTHVIHCAASVSFDDAYESSYRANVLGALNALEFSLGLQTTAGSPFVNHIAIETSYIHGRKRLSMAQEAGLVFPRHFYNNYYELTKAMASIETDRYLVEKGLRVAQLLPSIVIGHSRTGNNRGDTKVVNAPINAFGRSKETADRLREGDLVGRVKSFLIGFLAHSFPSDASAELNLVPVDRVVEGILAALRVPEAIGSRIHLATDNRIRVEDIARLSFEELGVKVRLADPTLFRNLTMPVVKGILLRAGEPKLAIALERLSAIFSGYGEWGQPVHEIGNDVRILGLALRRPDTLHAFRMLCRHNKYVQDFGNVRDPDEIAAREAVWDQALAAIELRTGLEAGALAPEPFRRLLAQEIDLKTFKRRRPAGRTARGREA